MARLLTLIFAALLLTDAYAQSEERVGDAYEIRMATTSETSGEGSSGSSRSVTTLVERVLAVQSQAVELEFDLPRNATPEDRVRTWQFPARVLKPSGQPFVLLNGQELNARAQSWLNSGGLTQAACGRWVFTWTAIKVECDPLSVLETLAAFDLRDIRDGASFTQPGAIGAAPLRAQSRSPEGSVLVVNLEVDPESIRRQRAEADVAVAEIMRQKPLALEDAFSVWKARRIAGKIAATFETNAAGRVLKRTTVTTIEITSENGATERQTTTSTVEAHPMR